MELWEMTLGEYKQSLKGKRIEHSYYNRQGQILMNHTHAVEGAIQLGKPIIKEVFESNIYLHKHIKSIK